MLYKCRDNTLDKLVLMLPKLDGKRKFGREFGREPFT